MTLRKKGRYWYGDNLDDLKTEMTNYSKASYEATLFAASQCPCGNHTFYLETDEDEGVAERTCEKCKTKVLMGDSAEYAADAKVDNHVCVCDNETFELLSGVALYKASQDVRWFYIGCKCTKCSLVGVFADWKCEAGDAAAFLAKV